MKQRTRTVLCPDEAGVQTESWTQSKLRGRVEWMPGTNSTLEDAKREAQGFVEHNIRRALSKLYRGEVKWYDALGHLQRPPFR